MVDKIFIVNALTNYAGACSMSKQNRGDFWLNIISGLRKNEITLY